MTSEEFIIEITRLKQAFQKNSMIRFQDLHRTLDLIQNIGTSLDDISHNTGTELTSNKQNSLAVDGTGTKYPTVDAVNQALSNIDVTIEDATTTTKGIIKLSGDLSGTASSPIVVGLSGKAEDNNVVHLIGDDIKNGNLTLNDILYLPDFAALPGSFNNIGVDENGAVINIPIETSTSGSIKVAVTNKTGGTIAKGSAVYVNGAQGSKATIDYALADPNVTTSAALGIVEADINDNASGYVVTAGEITKLNTNDFSNGDKVFVSATTPGALTSTPPVSPNNVVLIGTVTSAHATQGKILINIVYTSKLDRLIDVAINSPANDDVLTYEFSTGLWKNKPSPFPDATTTEKGKIKLAGDLAGTANAPTVPLVRYTNNTPTITSIGGIPSGSTFNGKTMTEMWTSLLYPDLAPTLTNPSNTFTAPLASIYEVGAIIASMTFTATFNRGTISPAYGTSGFRSGLPSFYNYTGPGLTTTASSSLSNVQSVANYTVPAGTSTWTGSVTYLAGEQPLTSGGNPSGTPYPAGTTSPALQLTTSGIYPIFYGKSSTLPVAGQALINSGTKVVATSTGTVSITFAASSEYIWFAIPQTSTDKIKWFTPSNNLGGDIGVSPSDLFANDTITSIASPTSLWSAVNYRIYISNFTTGTIGVMELRNS